MKIFILCMNMKELGDFNQWTDRVESDNFRVTLADIIDQFHTRHGNQRTTTVTQLIIGDFKLAGCD